MSLTIRERNLLSSVDSDGLRKPLHWFETFINAQQYMEPRPMSVINADGVDAEVGFNRIVEVMPELYYGTDTDVASTAKATGGILAPLT